jgi:hypothetical protein
MDHIFIEAVILYYSSRVILRKNGSPEGLFVENIASDVVERGVNIFIPSYDGAVANIYSQYPRINMLLYRIQEIFLNQKHANKLKTSKNDVPSTQNNSKPVHRTRRPSAENSCLVSGKSRVQNHPTDRIH